MTPTAASSRMAVLFKRLLLGSEKKFLAAPRGRGIKTKNAFHQSVGLTPQTVGWANLRDEADFEGALRTYRVAQQYQRKCKSGQSVFTQISHDGGRRKPGPHLGKSQLGMLGHESEIAEDREAEAKAEGISLNLCHADQGRGPQPTLDLDDTSRFRTDGLGVPACPFAPGAENVAARANPKYPRRGARCLSLELGQHGVEHRSAELVAARGIIQRKGEDISRSFDCQWVSAGIRRMRVLGQHAANGIQGIQAVSTTGSCSSAENRQYTPLKAARILTLR